MAIPCQELAFRVHNEFIDLSVFNPFTRVKILRIIKAPICCLPRLTGSEAGVVVHLFLFLHSCYSGFVMITILFTCNLKSSRRIVIGFTIKEFN